MGVAKAGALAPSRTPPKPPRGERRLEPALLPCAALAVAPAVPASVRTARGAVVTGVAVVASGVPVAVAAGARSAATVARWSDAVPQRAVMASRIAVASTAVRRIVPIAGPSWSMSCCVVHARVSHSVDQGAGAGQVAERAATLRYELTPQA